MDERKQAVAEENSNKIIFSSLTYIKFYHYKFNVTSGLIFAAIISFIFVVVTDLEDNIKKCREGDRKAQTALYNRFAPKMYGVCLRYSKDAAEAEDNLQEGFVRVFTKIDQYGFKGSFEGWMKRIMVNTALEKYRKKNQLYPVEDMAVFEGDSFDDNTLSDISAKDLLRIIQELPPRYRMVFNLYVIEGYSHREIGVMMNISEGTSKSNLSRARVILQKRVIEEFGLGKNTITTVLC